MNFEINRGFPIKPFSYLAKNSEQKIPQEQKELSSWDKKYFSSFLKDLLLPNIVSDLCVPSREAGFLLPQKYGR